MSPRDPDTYYPKFLVVRRSDCEVVDPTTCFTLIPDHDEHARVALKAYCDSCETDMPGLASALRTHFNL
jgi:hypothetical protein